MSLSSRISPNRVLFCDVYRDRAGGPDEIPGRPVGLWLIDARGNAAPFHQDQKSWQDTLVCCFELQSDSSRDPPEVGECSETKPASHCYYAPLKKDGTPSYDSTLKATNFVIICSTPQEQVTFKAALARICHEKSSSLLTWESTVMEGVYVYTDEYRTVSCSR